MKETKSNQKRLWIILAGLMTISLLIVFLYPVIFPLYAPGFTYNVQALWALRMCYPMDIITYLCPILSIIYLAIVVPKNKFMKRLKYYIAILAIILVCGIIYRWINTRDIVHETFYENFTKTNPEILYPANPDWYRSGFNTIDFIMWR